MNLRNRPVRLVAAVGAVLAAGTTTFMAFTAGTASADEPGRCTQNVNVREDPEADAKIVALCESGKQVKLGEERDGFVHLDELGGWASKDFVKADEDAASSDTDADGQHSADDASDPENGAGGGSASEGSNDAGHTGASHADARHADADHTDTRPSPRSTAGNGNGSRRGVLGGLLG